MIQALLARHSGIARGVVASLLCSDVAIGQLAGRPVTSTKSASIGLLLAIAIPSIAGISLILYATSNGVGVTYDSSLYIDAARHLAQGKGFVTLSPDNQLRPLTHFPPLYPALLSAMSFLSGGIPEAARFCGSCLFGATVAMCGWLVYRGTRHPIPALLAMGLCLFSPELVRIYTTAWSECAFLFMMLLCFYLVARACRDTFPLLCVAAGLAAAACMLTRFAAGPVVLAGMLALFFAGRRPWRRAAARAAVFGAATLLPVAAWMIRNLYVAGNATNRTWDYQPISTDRWVQAAQTIAGWWFPYAHSIQACAVVTITVLALLLIMSTLAWLAYARGQDEDKNHAGWFAGNTAEPELPAILAIFICLYLASLLVSIEWFDHATPLDWRILSPVFLCGLILQTIVIWTWLSRRAWVRQGLMRTAYVCAMTAVLFMYMGKSCPWVAVSHTGQDKSYNSVAWQKSSLLRWTGELPPQTVIYTNAPAALRYQQQRGTVTLLPLNATDLKKRGSHFNLVQRRLGTAGYVVFFHISPANHLDESRYVRAFHLKRIHTGSDGAVYELPPDYAWAD